MKGIKIGKYIAVNLLLATFISIVLMKPFHLLISHDEVDVCHDTHSSHHHHDKCTICLFAFDTSTESTPNRFSSPKAEVVWTIGEKPIARACTLLVEHVSPRAPPAL